MRFEKCILCFEFWLSFPPAIVRNNTVRATELSEFCTIVKGGRGKILFREVCNIFVRVLKISRDLTIFGRRIIDSSLFHHIVDLLP